MEVDPKIPRKERSDNFLSVEAVSVIISTSVFVSLYIWRLKQADIKRKIREIFSIESTPQTSEE